MKNTIGTNISLTIFGESHGEAIGFVLDGLPAGIPIDMDQIMADMDRRRARGRLSTQRHEEDVPQFLSGIFERHTCGTAITAIIPNKSQHSSDYAQFKSRLRPGHADFTAFEKYHGWQDYRGGGHFSGRITAAVVAAGSICRQVLKTKGIHIFSHIESLHGIRDRKPDLCDLDTVWSGFPMLDEDRRAQACALAEQAASEGDSVGGVLETVITGMPAGVGEPFFDSVESVLSHLLFSVPAVKGVSFGDGFGFADLYGSEANDAFIVKDGQIVTATNHNGGINGGITNGMPVVVHTVIKPTPSIYKEQDSVDYLKGEPVRLQITGRHDPCIIHRANVVVESVCALGLLDLYMSQLAQEALWNRE